MDSSTVFSVVALYQAIQVRRNLTLTLELAAVQANAAAREGTVPAPADVETVRPEAAYDELGEPTTRALEFWGTPVRRGVPTVRPVLVETVRVAA